MPIEVGIWRIDGGPQKVSFSRLESESKLEEILDSDISLLSSDLMLIGRQVRTAHGKFIDLLAMDAEGNLSIIELKRHRTPRDVVAQAIDYASWVQTLSYSEIVDLYAECNEGHEFEQAFDEAFGSSPPEKLNESLEIIVVAAELDAASERIINYLADNYGVPINAIFFRYFKDGDGEYLTRTWLIDPQDVEAKSSNAPASKGREKWNGQDYYVSFGEGDSRDWEDAVKYGFISGGGGRWYTRTLSMLSPGARIFVNLPGSGYAGVGTVLEPPVSVNEFMVEHDGKQVPILDVPLKAKNMGNGVGDDDKVERLVRVEWKKTVPSEEAYRFKGMYGNQNTVTKLRNRFTLERLVEYFDLDNE
jgi:hypothetical protein